MNISKHRIYEAKASREAKPKKQVAVAERTAVTFDLKTKEEQLAEQAIDYEMTNQRIKLLQARMKVHLRPMIEDELAKRGVEDVSGHKHLNLPGVELLHERHASITFNETAAEAILAKKGLLESVSHEEVITRRILDEEKIVEAYEAGLLTPKEFDKMFSEDVKWHFKVRVDGETVPEYNGLVNLRKRIETGEVEEMPEVEVS